MVSARCAAIGLLRLVRPSPPAPRHTRASPAPPSRTFSVYVARFQISTVYFVVSGRSARAFVYARVLLEATCLLKEKHDNVLVNGSVLRCDVANDQCVQCYGVPRNIVGAQWSISFDEWRFSACFYTSWLDPHSSMEVARVVAEGIRRNAEATVRYLNNRSISTVAL